MRDEKMRRNVRDVGDKVCEFWKLRLQLESYFNANENHGEYKDNFEAWLRDVGEEVL